MATEYRRKISLGFAFLLITSIFIAGLSGTAQRIDAAGGTRADSLPVLNDTTVLPDTIMMGDLVNFTVLYTDADDDQGEVRVRFERLNGSRGITDSSNPKMNCPEGGNYSQGVEYYYVKVFDMPGTYRYVFNVTDVELNETVVENGTEFQVILPVPDEGTLSGRVTTGQGNDTAPVAGAKVVIQYHDNETDNTTYFNSTTDANGDYEEMLPIVEEPYFAYVNASGYVDSDRYKFVLQTIANEVEKNFSIEAWEAEVPGDETGELAGYVKDESGVVPGATITVVIFNETEVRDPVTGNLTNETVRSYTNLTATSNATGAFLIEGIAAGTWRVHVAGDDYFDHSEEVVFGTGLVEKNFTLKNKPGPMHLYWINGTVVPADSTTTISGNHTIEHNTTNGNFSVSGLLNGDYILTVDYPGYDKREMTVTINGSNENIGTIYLIPIIISQDVNYTFGPVLDDNGLPVVDANISFTLNGVNYSFLTDVDGLAFFRTNVVMEIPNGTEITITKDDIVITWSYGEDIPVFAAEEELVEDNSLSTTIIIAVIVAALVLIIVAVVSLKK